MIRAAALTVLALAMMSGVARGCPGVPPAKVLSELVGQEVVLEGRLEIGKNADGVVVAGKLVQLLQVDRADFGELVDAQAYVRVRGALEFTSGTPKSKEGTEECNTASIPPHYFIRKATVELLPCLRMDEKSSPRTC